MDYSKICWGRLDVRKSVRALTTLNSFVFFFGIAVTTILSINKCLNYFQNSKTGTKLDLFIFGLFLTFCLLTYYNIKLKEATYTHNIKYIVQWLIFHSLLIMMIIAITVLCLLFKSISFQQCGLHFVIISIKSFEFYLVKYYYNDEIKFLATDLTYTITPTWNGPSDVTINNQPVPLYANYARSDAIQQDIHLSIQPNYGFHLKYYHQPQ